ncbi:MAG: hypothetical protein NTZ16_06650 [Verrucomicrobia bacterium]|nr:hypothetical protein [Verrucomicrobiota bacterium]
MKIKTILGSFLILGLAGSLFAAPAEGDLVQGSGTGVFVIKDGKRCGIPNPEVFAACGYKWDKVVKIPDADLKAIPEGPLVQAPIKPYPKAKDGDLVKGSGDGIFLIKDGKRCGFSSAEAFNGKGYKWDKVVKISDADLEAIPEGDPIEAQ